MTNSVGIGLIGAGFMGCCHANAFRSVAGLFDVPVAPELISLADVTDEAARDSLPRVPATGDD